MPRSERPVQTPRGRRFDLLRWAKIAGALLAPIATAIAGLLYADLKAWFLPDKISGAYVSLMSDEPGRPDQSQLALQSHDGIVKGTGQRGDKSWVYSGYLKNGYVVLSYRSADATGIGFGTFFVVDPTGDAREYVGYYEGNVCPQRQVYRCNMVLLRGNQDGPEAKAALSTHAEFLDRRCAPVEGFTTPTSASPCK